MKLDAGGQTAGPSDLPRLSFALINRRGFPDYDPDLQRHHILPRQLMGAAAFRRMFASLGQERIGFHDFRRNGILLPARTGAAARTGLPLHRGPHRDYNRMVMDRLGRIEAIWSRASASGNEMAHVDALMQISLLRRALRRRILDVRRPLRFNRNAPLGAGRDFSLLDRMAEELWLAAETC